MKKLGYLIIIVISTSPVFALYKDAGTAGSSFLKIGVGPRSLSMANTFTAVTGEVSSIFSNPAGTAGIMYPAIFSSASQWIEGTKYGSVAYIHPFTKRIVSRKKKRRKKVKNKKRSRNLGLDEKSSRSRRRSRSSRYVKESTSWVGGIGMLYFDAGSMDATDKDQYDFVIPKGTQVSAVDQMMVAHISKSFPQFAIGLNLKYISQKLASYTATAYAADAGIIYHIARFSDTSYWDCGIAYYNAGTELDFRIETEHTDTLPESARIGSFWRIGKLGFAFDLVLPNDNDLRGDAACEYSIAGGSTFRLGLKAFGYDTIGDDYYFSNIRLGIGVPIGIMQGTFDYAFVPMGDFGFSHHISLTFFFGKSQAEKESDWLDSKW